MKKDLNSSNLIISILFFVSLLTLSCSYLTKTSFEGNWTEKNNLYKIEVTKINEKKYKVDFKIDDVINVENSGIYNFETEDNSILKDLPEDREIRFILAEDGKIYNTASGKELTKDK